MKKALVIGVDYYSSFSQLYGCSRDALSVAQVLNRNGDGSINFDVKVKTSFDRNTQITQEDLREDVEQLFTGECETALFYFAGHGQTESTGGYLLASDSSIRGGGLPLNDVITWANRANRIRNKIIILDSCNSGIAGNREADMDRSELCDGLTILTASTEHQYAAESSQGGVFTSLLIDALSGAASNLLGNITPGSVYAHIDQSLGPWDQRPVFKTNVKSFIALRSVQPAIQLADLRRIIEFFPAPGHDFKLDPSFEPERTSDDQHLPPPDPINTEKLALLQKFNRVNLVVPVDAPHMYHAAMESKSCRLTALGEHYRRLVHNGRI